MNKQDIKVGMLVKSSLYASVLPHSVGMVISYHGKDRVYVLCGENIFSWDIAECIPVGVDND